MSNLILSNDSRLTSLEVTDYLKIPTCTEAEIKRNAGKEGEVKFNVTNNCLMIRTPKEWKSIPLKPCDDVLVKPSAPPPPYPAEERKTMRMKIEKKNILVEFLDIIEPMIYQQLDFLMSEAKKLKIKKIVVNKNNSDRIVDYLHKLSITFKHDHNGNLVIENYKN
jgi:hypothetical protein